MNSQELQFQLDEIADEFLIRRRNGEHPSIEEYELRHPDIAEAIRDFLTTLNFINKHKGVAELSSVGDQDDRSFENESIPEIEDFRIIRVAGRGGMGIVYEAEQISLSRRVALKVLPPTSIQDRNAVERFQMEARSAAGLHHSNIVPVYEVGKRSDHYFYAMQFIDGQSLDFVTQKLKGLRTSRFPSEQKSTANRDDALQTQTKIDTARIALSSTLNLSSPSMIDSASSSTGTKPFYRNVAHLGQQIAAALHYAHGQGIVHRDIKPANLMVDLHGNVWVTDFGLAKSNDQGLTRTGDIVGTLRYMSPERFAGKCDRRSDIYSLGMTLFELLVQRPAFANEDRLELIGSIKNDQPVSLKKLDPRMPGDLQTIIEKAIEKEPRRRYADAGEFAADLSRFIDGRPIKARKVGSTERLLLWAKKRKALASSLTAILLLLVAGSVAATVAAFNFRNQGIKQAQLASQNLTLATQNQQEKIVAETQRDLANQNSYFADIQLALQDWQDGQILRMMKTLQRYVPATPSQDVRNWEWYYLLSLAHQEDITIFGHEKGVTQVRWSRDGNRLYSASMDGSLRIWNPKGEMLRMISIPGLLRFAISPDGATLATASGDSALRYWSAETGELLRAIDTNLGSLIFVDWSKNANRIVVAPAGRNEKPKVYDSKTDKLVLEIPTTGARCVAISPDGKRLATQKSGEINLVWNVDSGELINELPSELDGDSQVLCFAWHPDSLRIASGHFLSGVQLFELVPGAKKAKRLVRFKGDSSVESLTFSKDGTRLLTGDRTQVVDVYETETGKPLKQCHGHLGWVKSVDWHTDSQRFASAGLDGAIKIWDAEVSKSATPAPYATSGTSGDFRWRFKPQTRVLTVRDLNDDVVATIPRVCLPTGFTVNSKTKKAVVRIFPNDIAIFDTVSWREIDNLFINTTHSIANCFYSWHGDFVAATNGGGYVAVVDLKNETIRRIPAHDADKVGLDLSPNGEMLTTIAYGEVKLWDSASGKELAQLYGHSPGRWSSIVKWGNEGRFFATSGWDQKVFIWDAKNKSLWKILDGHQSVPNRLIFSKDDSRLMSIGKSIKIWDVTSGREVGTFARHQSPPSSDEFPVLDARKGFGLPESALRFEGFRVLEQVTSDDSSLRKFERQSNLNLAMKILNSTETSTESLRQSLEMAKRAFELAPTDLLTTQLLARAQLKNRLSDEARKTIDLAFATEAKNLNTQLLDAIQLATSGERELGRERLRGVLATIADPTVNYELVDKVLLHWAAKSALGTRDKDASTTIVVNTLTDELDGIGIGGVSLREALLHALPGDTIEFSVSGKIELKFGQLLVNKSVIIKGPGDSKLSLDAGKRSRVLFVCDYTSKEVDIEISGLRIENGEAPVSGGTDDWKNRGGGIFSTERLTIENCVLENHSALRGGALWVDGPSTTRLLNCTLQKNFAESGGAITVSGSRWGKPATLYVESSTLNDNRAKTVGGAVYSYGHVKMINSTVHNNLAVEANLGQSDWMGGGITYSLESPSLALEHCTITENGGGGVGIMVEKQLIREQVERGATFELAEGKIARIRNSIIHGNTRNGKPFDVGLPFGELSDVADISHSLLGASDGSIDRKDVLVGVDPKLGPLVDNGGATKTRMLAAGSPCIDSGVGGKIEFDQRGDPFARNPSGGNKRDAAPDLGAVEFHLQ